MKRETAKLLHDALSASTEASDFCLGVSRDELRRDRRSQLAVQKLIEIVGEALHQAELTEPEAVADLAILRRAVDTRNRLVHGYASVDYGVVWDIATKRLPALRVQLEEKLRDAPLSSYGVVD